jgi:ribosomal protein S15P/S13E
MKCSDVERILPDIIDDAGNAELQAHLKSCSTCGELVSDLRLISSEARTLAESHEPPARLWVRIANELRAEGIIHEPVAATPARPILVPSPARRWNAWWLAPVAAAIVAAGSYQLVHNQGASPVQTAQQPPARSSTPEPAAPPNVAQSATSQPAVQQPTQSAPASAAQDQPAQVAQRRAAAPLGQPTAIPARVELSSPPNDDDQRFLSEVSSRIPTMRATYEKQLRAVNTEIQETQEYIKRHPEDMDARQHLLETYQQKVMLYQMALDRIQ